MTDNFKVELAVIQTDMTYLKKHMEIIEKKIDNAMVTMSNTYVPKTQFTELENKVKKIYDERKNNKRTNSDRWFEIIKSAVLIIFAVTVGWVAGGGMA